MKTLNKNIDHFENETFEEHADIFDDLANQVPGGNTIRNLAGGVGKLFGVGKEDKSDTGFKAALASGVGQLPFYPTKEEMLKAARNGFPDKNEPAAIEASYNPSNGTWKRGDWNFVVTSTNPIQAKLFKGAKESGIYKSTVQAAIPQRQQVATQQSMSAVHTSDMPKGSSDSQLHSVKYGSPEDLALRKKSKPFSGAADLTDEVKNLIPAGTTGYIMIGFVVLIVVIVAFVAFKK